MSTERVASPSRAEEAGQTGLFDRLLAAPLRRELSRVGIGLRLWDDPADAPSGRVGDLIVGDRRVLFGLLIHPELYFGEAYMEGRLQVRGELEPILEALCRLRPPRPSRIARWHTRLARPNSRRTSRRNVHHHYDLGNDFYRLWLDKEMLYTCAYFPEPDVSLEDAQRAKMDLVCRKLRIQPGDRVIEAGCGWGALALHMAREYGAQVRAFNISREQIAWARERALKEGLAGQVEFVEDDYRNVTGRFDVFVSVGMLEHVGRAHYPSLGEVIHRTLDPRHGRGLLHFIGRDAPRPLNAWIRRRIFPGAYPPTLAEVAEGVLTPFGLSVLDVENLRLHYARTLSHWSRRFAAAADYVQAAYGDSFRRAWELYLAGSQAAFATGWLQLFQVAFAPAEAEPPYWTRASLYTHARV
ncbi:MAG TPA: cyclopropane-fatty-acyl-phospholipid synthase family protein [Vicinamibacterales bacterium]|nr:cyclopropane-fatty-acyl-phospholipid synthase family protein [Vicinamibacterales bacterium]